MGGRRLYRRDCDGQALIALQVRAHERQDRRGNGRHACGRCVRQARRHARDERGLGGHRRRRLDGGAHRSWAVRQGPVGRTHAAPAHEPELLGTRAARRPQAHDGRLRRAHAADALLDARRAAHRDVDVGRQDDDGTHHRPRAQTCGIQRRGRQVYRRRTLPRRARIWRCRRGHHHRFRGCGLALDCRAPNTFRARDGAHAGDDRCARGRYPRGRGRGVTARTVQRRYRRAHARRQRLLYRALRLGPLRSGRSSRSLQDRARYRHGAYREHAGRHRSRS